MKLFMWKQKRITQKYCPDKIALIMGILCLTVFSIGCGRSAKLDGYPDRHPCVITILQEGQPLAGVSVIAIPTESADPAIKRRPLTGNTDADGHAKMITSGHFKGMPEGSYIVTVSLEKVVFDHEITEEERTQEKFRPGKVYTLIEKQMTEDATSPLKIEVKPGKNEFTLDVGKKVEQFLYKLTPPSM